jgi:hypothetical protein
LTTSVGRLGLVGFDFDVEFLLGVGKENLATELALLEEIGEIEFGAHGDVLAEKTPSAATFAEGVLEELGGR